MKLNIFKEDILLCKNIDYRLDDISKARARKLIQLGMGSKQDIIDELIDNDINNMFSGEFSIGKFSELLGNIYSKIDEDNINKLYENTFYVKLIYK